MPIQLDALEWRDGGNSEARFIREALITATLQHPSIVPVYEVGRWPSLDARADLCALGAILYPMLAGTPPYSGRSSAEVLAKVSSESPIPLEQRGPGRATQIQTPGRHLQKTRNSR